MLKPVLHPMRMVGLSHFGSGGYLRCWQWGHASCSRDRDTCRAAVHFEMADYDATIKDCEAAVERGRELRADFKMVARALTRKGNALVKMGDLPAAIATYNKALTEHRWCLTRLPTYPLRLPAPFGFPFYHNSRSKANLTFRKTDSIFCGQVLLLFSTGSSTVVFSSVHEVTFNLLLVPSQPHCGCCCTWLGLLV